ncbi:Peroxide stress regulator PerR, FUR family [Halanaerobium saccharolyticum subsp. saccharolyticum DSM 6643]|uniref:Peroxide stress regulator PerR, FUR family n=1 Tax=Halanaerobium saccharolyticum subsp. saccharolyticum DSM 6643 TaxID=1293054 RepID=M5E229_9FIRM|nr:transcriptional repressor [Halanaerobium saccharolyticum]CCU79578.1 Peroxide stress regulator PerR, FUR family [Halanaerobium saccharolyticum subsp. saccharolyticum DSM 6643]
MAKKTRMTKQRKAILKVLKNTKSHPTADWIYEKVRKEIPNISLGTVYRNLNVLAENGKIKVLDYGSNHSRYDGVPDHHYHFRCEKCGGVFDLDVDLSSDLNKKINNETEFTVHSHRLEFSGICPDCQQKN